MTRTPENPASLDNATETSPLPARGIQKSSKPPRKALILWAIWLVVVLVLDFAQFGYFDCSTMPDLSLVLGFPVLGAAVGFPLVLVYIWIGWTSPLADRIAASVAAGILAGVIVFGLGFIWLLTHMAP